MAVCEVTAGGGEKRRREKDTNTCRSVGKGREGITRWEEIASTS